MHIRRFSQPSVRSSLLTAASPAPGSHARRGAAAVEFSFIMPVLVLVLAGAADFCRFGHTAVAVNNAARAGVAFGCMHPCDTLSSSQWLAKVEQAVRDELSSSGGFDVSRLQINATLPTSGSDRRCSVEVNYPFRTVVAWLFVPSEMSVRRSATLPMLR